MKNNACERGVVPELFEIEPVTPPLPLLLLLTGASVVVNVPSEPYDIPSEFWVYGA
jgi:hypothetical protein